MKRYICAICFAMLLATGCSSAAETETVAQTTVSAVQTKESTIVEPPAGDTASAICYQGIVYYGLDASCDPPEETAGAEYVGKTKAMETEGAFISPQEELEFTGGGGLDVYVVMQNDTVQKFIIQLENPDIAPGYVALDSLTTEKPDYYDTDTE